MHRFGRGGREEERLWSIAVEENGNGQREIKLKRVKRED
jgi:hypothetical protein